MLTKLTLTACFVALVAPIGLVHAQQQSPAVKATNRLERDALWNWLTYGRLGNYTPEIACRDAGRGAPEASIASCVSLVRTQAAMDQQAQTTFKNRRSQDEENAVRELVSRAAAGDWSAEARCQWAVDGMQREQSAWQECRTRVRAAFKATTESGPKTPGPTSGVPSGAVDSRKVVARNTRFAGQGE